MVEHYSPRAPRLVITEHACLILYVPMLTWDIIEKNKIEQILTESFLQVRTVNHRSFRGLLWHLLYSDKQIKCDLDKVR